MRKLSAAVFAAWGVLAVLAVPTGAQSPGLVDASVVCSERHEFGAKPVDVAKTADGATVLATTSWNWHDAIGCYLTLDDQATAALRAADPPSALPTGVSAASQICSDHHQFGLEPVDVAKTENGNTVLARLVWNWHDQFGCYLTLDPKAVGALQAAHAEPVFSQISVGRWFACGVSTDRSVKCWGYSNSWGKASPPPGEFTQVAAGYNHTCALAVGGEVRCWGDDYHGFTDPPEGVFKQVTTWCALRADGSFVCWGPAGAVESPPGLRVERLVEGSPCGHKPDGTVVCWNVDHSGRWYGEPALFEMVEAPADGVFAHVGNLCGVRLDGSVECWGAKPPDPSAPPGGAFVETSDLCGITVEGGIECWGTGQYGSANRPDEAPAGRYKQLSAGPDHACGLRTDGRVRCWGSGYGPGPDPPQAEFAQVSVGATHPCGITTEGRLECWDRRFRGDAPDEAGWQVPDPAELPEGRFAQVSVGGFHRSDSMACAVRTDGAISCWDYDGPTAAPDGRFSKVSVGRYGQSCALRNDGAVECWAWEVHGSAPSPPASERFTVVSATDSYACGVRTDGSLSCWGDSDRWPSEPPAGAYTQVSMSRRWACAVRVDARLQCWSWLPESPAERKLRVPDDPPEGSYTAVSVTDSYACGLKADGSIKCWGSGTIGKAQPPQGTFTQVSAGPEYACAINNNKTLQCWG